MKKIIGLMLFYSFGAVALEIKIQKMHELTLQSKSCDELIQEHKNICDWKRKIQPDFISPEIKKSDCIKDSSKKFSMKVTTCLPDFVDQNLNKKNYHHGSNCWGTALNFKNYSLKPRYVWSEEMIYWLESPICRKLNVNEPIESGDFLNTYGPEYIFSDDKSVTKGEIFWQKFYPNRYTPTTVEEGYSGFDNFFHTETFISPLISFGKNSPAKDDYYEFHLTKEIYARSRDPKCQEDQLREPYLRQNQNPPGKARGKECDYYSIAYRCENFEAYFKSQNLTQEESLLLNEIHEIQQYQKELFALQMSLKIGLTKKRIDEILSLSDRESNLALDALQTTSLAKTHEMLLVWKYFSASGLRKTLELSKLTTATEEM